MLSAEAASENSCDGKAVQCANPVLTAHIYVSAQCG